MPNATHVPTDLGPVVFAYIDEPPFAAPGPNGSAVGCDVELALTALIAIGVPQVRTQLTTFAELVPGVAQGRWTMSTALFITPERAAHVTFSRPIWALNDGFVVRADSVMLNSHEAIAQRRATLGVVSGQVQHHTALRAGVSPDHVHEFATQARAIDALLAGDIDAYASTAVGNRTLVRQLGHEGLRAVDETSRRAPSRRGAPLGAYCFRHADVRLREAFDAFLLQYLGSAAHRTQMASHGLSATEIDPVLHGQPSS